MARLGRGRVDFVIEHLEPRVSTWVLLEYAHAASIVGRDALVVTNVPGEGRERLRDAGLRLVYGESVADLYEPERLVVLDLKAEEPLRPADILGVDAIVVGGIMGDHPPKGRTWRLLTSRLRGARVRHLGLGQLSVDGAIYVAHMVSRGVELGLIPLVEGVRISWKAPLGLEQEVFLPFTYPLVGGKPLLAPGLEEYLRRGAVYEELAHGLQPQ